MLPISLIIFAAIAFCYYLYHDSDSASGGLSMLVTFIILLIICLAVGNIFGIPLFFIISIAIYALKSTKTYHKESASYKESQADKVENGCSTNNQGFYKWFLFAMIIFVFLLVAMGVRSENILLIAGNIFAFGTYGIVRSNEVKDRGIIDSVFYGFVQQGVGVLLAGVIFMDIVFYMSMRR